MSKIIPASATEVREFFLENSALVPENDKTVGREPGSHRGRLSQDAQRVFSEKTGRTYVNGHRSDLVEMTVSYKQPSGKSARKTVSLPTAEVRSLAGSVAKSRGRLTAEAMEAAQVALSERLTAESAERAAAKAKG